MQNQHDFGISGILIYEGWPVLQRGLVSEMKEPFCG